MTRQVRLPDRPELRLNETELAVLRFVSDRSGAPEHPVCVSARELSQVAGKNVSTARACIMRLCSKGLLISSERWLRNGARAENSLELSDDGRLVLYYARHLTLPARPEDPAGPGNSDEAE